MSLPENSVPYNHAPAPSGGPPPASAGIDFGWLAQAWSLFTAQVGTWVGAMLLFFLVDAALALALSVPTGMLATWRGIYMAVIVQKPPPVSRTPYQDFAQTQVFAVLLAACQSVLAAGAYRMGMRQWRGEPISALGIFSAFPRALPLLVVGAAVPALTALLEGAVLWLMHFSLSPAIAVSLVSLVAWLPGLILPGLFMFAPLLVLDTGASAPAALVGSVRLLGRQWLLGVVFYIVVSLIGGLGAVVCGVGMLATYPIFLLSIAVGYLSLVYPPVPRPVYSAPPAQAGVWPPAPQNSPPPQWGPPPSGQ